MGNHHHGFVAAGEAAIIGEAITALAAGSSERGIANQAILAMRNESAIVAAQQVASATLQRLGIAVARLEGSTPPMSLATLHETAGSLARIVYVAWSVENDLLELMRQGRMEEAAQLGARVNAEGPRSEELGRRLSMELHRLAADDAGQFQALELPRAVVLQFGLPDPEPPIPEFDADAWLEEFIAPLRSVDRTERAIALRAEAERWQVIHADLLRQRDDLPNGMTRQAWFAALEESGSRTDALRGALTSLEGWPSLAEVPARLPGTGQVFTLALDGSGDFATFEEAMAAIPSGARLSIRPGRYEAGALIAKSLDIAGEGPPGSVVFEGIYQSVIPVMALGGSLRNVTIRNVGGPDRYGLWISNGEILVEECDISSGGDAAVFVTGTGAAPRLSRCSLSGPGACGILLRLGAARLDRCRIEGCSRAGASAQDRSTLELDACEIAGNGGTGVAAGEGSFAQLRNCRIEGNGEGGVSAGVESAMWLWECAVLANGGWQYRHAPLADLRIDGQPAPA